MVGKKRTTKRKATKRKPARNTLTTWGGNKPNLRAYKTQPNSKWREPTDVARSLKGARSAIKNYPPEYDAIIVKTPGKGKKTFPYHIWTIKDERIKAYRREQYKKNGGKRWS